jgi:hypothetical protein
MTAREISENELLDAILTSRLRSVHTALPGTIRSYDEDDQTATVECAVQLEATTGAFQAVAPLADVPVTVPGAWAAGDRCLLVFCEESFSKWMSTGSVEPPEVLVRHGLHAVCIPWVEGESDFVALKGLVEAAILDLLSNLISSAAAITAPGGGPAFVTALTAYQTLITTPGPTALQVGAEKVKAV